MTKHSPEWWRDYRARKAAGRASEQRAPGERAALPQREMKPAPMAADEVTLAEWADDKTELEKFTALGRATMFDGESLSAVGLAFVRLLARTGAKTGFVATSLGLTRAQWKPLWMKDKGENPTRDAFEAGYSIHEERHRRSTERMGHKYFVVKIHYGKAVLGWRETEPPQIEVNVGPEWVLPGAMSQEDYYRKVGQVGPREAVPLPGSTKFISDQRRNGGSHE